MMKKTFWTIIAVCAVLNVTLFAAGVTRISFGSALPTNCVDGNIFVKTSATTGVYWCSTAGSPGTWSNIAGAGGGTVTTSGSPASGNLAKFSGATSITNVDLSGDVTTSGSAATTLAASGVTAASYGDSTHVPQITFDAKGRATSASTVAISSGIGDWVKVDEVLPSGSTGVVTFSSLGSYNHLRIVFSARSDASATSDGVNMTFNGDTSAHYDGQRNVFATTDARANQIAQTSAVIAVLTAATGAASYSTTGEILINDYRSTVFFKSAVCIGVGPVLSVTSTDVSSRLFSAHWRSTSAITSITFTLGTGHYVSGSKFTLYGTT